MTTPLGQVGSHAGTFIAGAVAAMTVVSSKGVDVYAAYDHLMTGVREFGAAWAIIGPVILAGWAAYKATPREKLKDVIAAPNAIEVAKEIPVTQKTIAVAEALKTNGH